jgi:hypothetical protein
MSVRKFQRRRSLSNMYKLRTCAAEGCVTEKEKKRHVEKRRSRRADVDDAGDESQRDGGWFHSV